MESVAGRRAAMFGGRYCTSALRVGSVERAGGEISGS